ncbi:Galactinol--raffinose galactosyltransferase [Handroanthus impetiginosus]|uniref:Galactinol--raffinose galactosyltransferase n=1 Tax=Handroanthus impetiginosus TaxID=429701 RepID=A0A2G9HDJ8_9LAMI|nr:Galactinol--raffinose galactosyltransferase [Handroanthus impetiginosus]
MLDVPETKSYVATVSIIKGKFRDFVSIFRFKTWWSTEWVGNAGSDIQMETQWIMLDVPEVESYVVIIPIIEGKFRSALHTGSDGHMLICAESGSTHHMSYALLKEACTAVRVHLNTFKLIEEKLVPPLVNKFGRCTWDAFLLTVEPAGIWHGVEEFADGGLSVRFLIINDGWQSINIDGEDPNEDAKNIILPPAQMTARLHRLDERERFRKYKGGSMTGRNRPPYDPKKTKLVIHKAFEVGNAIRASDEAAQSRVTDLSQYEIEIDKLKGELNEMRREVEEEEEKGLSKRHAKSENYGMEAFTKDLRTNFKGLDDIYVWHALAGAWGGIIEGSIGLVDPGQAEDFYYPMHSYLSKVGITGVKVDVMHERRIKGYPSRKYYFLHSTYLLLQYGGAVGAFNCQGAGWDPKERRIKGYPQCYKPLSGSVHMNDIEWDEKNETTEMGEIFSFMPIKKIGNAIKFTPIGLTSMFNSGGTIQDLSYTESIAKIEVKGEGKFLAYSSVAPKKAYMDGAEVVFEWSENGKLILDISWLEEHQGISYITFVF